MKPRLVDWSLLAVVLFVFATGLISLLAGHPRERWIFIVHGAGGIALLVLLFWKFRQVLKRVLDPRRWDAGTLLSLTISALALASVGTGILWVLGELPLRAWPNGMGLHGYLAFALIPLFLWHVLLRRKPLRRVDWADRRNALRYLGLLAFGAVAWGGQELVARALSTEGARRRFTGSREWGSDQGLSYPTTSWVADNPAPVNIYKWRLRIHGAVERPLEFAYRDLIEGGDVQRATLDCTGGWYSTHNWSGVRVGWLFQQARPLPTARWVSFVSITGYRWSLALEEAAHALLATQVDGQRLDHGHGFPLRLVAPGRRGFQWVKWVQGLEVRDEPDYQQWLSIFTSGFVGR
ncbi:MAG: molybdopterin-dependent oxidoreductase [Chloroflexi bacterium]|nr:molybdopterin-dependent oxidoreductase [Chloroflexota bacterium]